LNKSNNPKLGSLVKKMEKVKKPKGRKVAAKNKATEIT
jgi:hypothetical protein